VEIGAPTPTCNGSCPESREMCGDQCIPKEWSSSLYSHYKQWFECNGQCVRGNVPCNGSCSDGMTACGNRCVRDDHIEKWYKECNGECITRNSPCNGECEDGQILCGNICRLNNTYWRDCNGNCIHKTQACNGECPVGSVLCGNSSRCITPDDRSFKECNGECIPFLTPCDNLCPNGTVSCGDQCLEQYNAMYAKECDGKCIDYMEPCNGECGSRMLFCPHSNETQYDWYTEHSDTLGYCAWDDGYTYYCGDYCKGKDQSCDGECSEGWEQCGSISSEPEQFYRHPQCIKNGNTNGYYRNCDGQCISGREPCNGECKEGFTYCNGYCANNQWDPCNGTCPEGWEKCGTYRCMKKDSEESTHWNCSGNCYPKNVPCNDECAEGWLPCGNWSSKSYKTCYHPSSAIQPCHGECLRDGAACDGQCPAGFSLCTLGYSADENKQVCYNDSDSSFYYFYNGYCWHKDGQNTGGFAKQ